MRITSLIVLLITLFSCIQKDCRNLGVPTNEQIINYQQEEFYFYSNDTIVKIKNNYFPEGTLEMCNQKYKLWLLELEQKSGV